MVAVPVLVPMHLGALHPVEQALTLALAFGPFVVLAIVIWVRRRDDHATDQEGPGSPGPSSRTSEESDLSG